MKKRAITIFSVGALASTVSVVSWVYGQTIENLTYVWFSYVLICLGAAAMLMGVTIIAELKKLSK